MCVGGALDHESHFSSPLYKFVDMRVRRSIRTVPSYVAVHLLRGGTATYLYGAQRRRTGLGRACGCRWFAASGQARRYCGQMELDGGMLALSLVLSALEAPRGTHEPDTLLRLTS